MAYQPCDCGTPPPGCPCDPSNIWKTCVVNIAGIANTPCDDSSFHIYGFHFCNYGCDVDFSIINGGHMISTFASPCGRNASKVVTWQKNVFQPMPFQDSICTLQTYTLNILTGIFIASKTATGYKVNVGISLFPVVTPLGVGLCLQPDASTKTVDIVNCGDPVNVTFNLTNGQNCGSTYSYRQLTGPATVSVLFN